MVKQILFLAPVVLALDTETQPRVMRGNQVGKIAAEGALAMGAVSAAAAALGTKGSYSSDSESSSQGTGIAGFIGAVHDVFYTLNATDENNTLADFSEKYYDQIANPSCSYGIKYYYAELINKTDCKKDVVTDKKCAELFCESDGADTPKCVPITDWSDVAGSAIGDFTYAWGAAYWDEGAAKMVKELDNVDADDAFDFDFFICDKWVQPANKTD